MRRQKHMPLMRAIAGPISLITLLVFVGSAIVSLLMINGTIRQSRQLNLSTIGDLFTDSVTRAVLSGDYAEVYRQCHDLLKHDAIYAISMRDAQGVTLCEFQEKSDGRMDQRQTERIYFDESRKNIAATITFSYTDTVLAKVLTQSLFLLLITSLLLIGIHFAFVQRLMVRIMRPLHALLEPLRGGNLSQLSQLQVQVSSRGVTEFGALFEGTQIMAERVLQAQEQLIEHAQAVTVARIAAQVAHDIRSPLTALQVVTGHLAEVPEARRVMIRNAVQRITDIVNDLATRRAAVVEGVGRAEVAGVLEGAAAGSVGGPRAGMGRAHDAEAPGDSAVVVLLSSLVDTLLSEKRTQCRAQLGVRIEGDVTEATYGLFVQVVPAALQRVLSNLINNAVEALAGEGLVTVTMVPIAGRVEMRVQDTGPGIPPEILRQLMQRGATFGKPGGSGLGLYHARSTVAAWRGTLRLESVVGQGTTAIVQLPVATSPAWFVPAIELPVNGPIIIVDDDSSIHQVWDGRLVVLGPAADEIPVQHFSSGTAVLAAAPFSAEALWLCDYELLGDPNNGLELIARLGVAARAILVTSRYEEPTVQARAAALGVRILPKGLAGLVPLVLPALPVEAAASPAKPNVLVVDDDEDIRFSWEMMREPLGIGELATFASMEACEAAQPHYAAYDLAFVDKQIPASRWRLDQVITHLKHAGVRKVYVASGEGAEALAHDATCQAADGIVKWKIPETLPS